MNVEPLGPPAPIPAAPPAAPKKEERLPTKAKPLTSQAGPKCPSCKTVNPRHVLAPNGSATCCECKMGFFWSGGRGPKGYTWSTWLADPAEANPAPKEKKKSVQLPKEKDAPGVIGR